MLICVQAVADLPWLRLARRASRVAWVFVRDHLGHLPVVDGQRGQALAIRERMEDRLYDRMLAFHVNRRIPVPVTTADFTWV